MAAGNNPKKLLLLFDILVVSAAFFLAVFIRFHEKPGMRGIAHMYDGLYYLIFELVLAIYVAVFFINESGSKPLAVQNPFEKTVGVIKNQLSLSICLVVLLYVIKRGFWASRAVVLMLFVFGTAGDIFVRFIYGKHLRKLHERMKKPRRLLFITEDEDPESRKNIVNELLDGGDRICEVISTDLLDEADGIPVSTDNYDGIITDSEKAGTILRKKSIPHDHIISEGDSIVSPDMTGTAGKAATVRFSGLSEKCPVLGVSFTASNLAEALQYIREHIDTLKGKYICFGNAHTSVMAYEDSEYKEIQNGAAFVFPDGAPIQKELHKRGHVKACRVAGPDFMRKAFISAMDGRLSMYFYGSTDNTVHRLEKKLIDDYPGIDLKGFESPPFRELTRKEDEEAVKRINDSGADILWVGLGAPKQEKWMATHKNRINALMLGVGAGFDFHAGTIKRAPEWIQKIGLEWLFRLLQDPKRLFRRYLITNTKYYLYKTFGRAD